MGTENAATMVTVQSDLILCYFTFDFIVYPIILAPLLETNATAQSNLIQLALLIFFPSNLALFEKHSRQLTVARFLHLPRCMASFGGYSYIVSLRRGRSSMPHFDARDLLWIVVQCNNGCLVHQRSSPPPPIKMSGPPLLPPQQATSLVNCCVYSSVVKDTGVL